MIVRRRSPSRSDAPRRHAVGRVVRNSTLAGVKSLLLAGALLGSDCAFLLSPVTGDIRLFLIGEPGPGGSTVVIRLRNESDRTVSYNLCFSTLERRTGEDWHTAQVGPAGGVCPTTRYQLQPAASADSYFALQEGLTPGNYRLRTSARYQGERRSFSLLTPTFVLR